MKTFCKLFFQKLCLPMLSIFSSQLFAVDYIVPYNPLDATVNIQAGIDSGADKIILEYQGAGTKWISGPLFLKSNIELYLEPGVILEAKSGAFLQLTDSVLKGYCLNNLKISGYDAEIRMLINEYTTGEWRNCISLYSCSNVQITGVKLSQSGGDGIYLGVSGSQKYSDNVLIKDVSCSGNGRQGISVISAKDLVIENCTFSDTGIYNPAGLAPHGPWAGIDFEMNNDDERFENIIVRDCNFINNRRYGIVFHPKQTDNVSILVENCYIADCEYGFAFNNSGNSGAVSNYIEVKNVDILSTRRAGILVNNWIAGNLIPQIENCKIMCPSTICDDGGIRFISSQTGIDPVGGINFNNVDILDNYSEHAITLYGETQNNIIKDIMGNIYCNDKDADIQFNSSYQNITVSLQRETLHFSRVLYSADSDVGGVDEESFFTSEDAQIYTGDYNGDGKTDLFVKGYQDYRALYLANSSGTGFARVFMGSSDGVGGTDSEPFFTDSAAQIYTGDYNGDGKTDLFVKGYQDYRALYLANSSGNGFICAFSGDIDNLGGTDSESFFTSPNAKIFTGDYNGDGKTDLFVKGVGTYRALYLANSSGTGFARVFMGSSDGVGGTDSEPFFTDSAAQIYTGDYNGDGKTDLFVKGYQNYRALYLANASGNGFVCAFSGDSDNIGGTDSEPFFTDSAAQIYTGDYDGDGKTDLFLKGYQNYRALYLANASGNGFVCAFSGDSDNIGGTDSEPFFTDSAARIYTGDYDGDGKTDLFVKGYQTYRLMYLAKADGKSFKKVLESNLDNVFGTDSESFFTNYRALIFTGDYNNDGRTDLFVKGYYKYRAMYLMNSFYTVF